MDASQGSSAARIFPMPQTIPAPPLASSSAAALPSSSLSLSSYSSSSLRHAPSITSFPILVLTVLGILAASVLLLAYYVFVIRCCLTWHRGSSGSSSDVAGLILSRRPRRTRTDTSGSSIQASAGGAAPADDAEPRGLEDAAIRALPAFSYRRNSKPASADEPSAPASECAVCLGEFEEGDRVRMLPACLHVFHLACVDAWLQGSTSCPLCRADVAATLLPPPPPEVEEEGEEVAIQVVVVPGGAGAEEDDQGTLPRRQREAIVAMAPAEDHQVGGDKTKSAIDGCHGMTERRNDGDVLPTRTTTSFSMDGDTMPWQIQSILQRDSHS